MKQFLLFICALLFFPLLSNAHHFAGGEITYKWLHDSTYRVTLHFYRNCSGIAGPTTVDICYYNNCNSDGGVLTLSKDSLLPDGKPNGSEIQVACPIKQTACTDYLSTLTGFRESAFSANVTLNSRCDHWTFGGSPGARDVYDNVYSVTTMTSYIAATLDNLNAPHNSSALFTTKPLPYIIDHIPLQYNIGALDADPDSINVEIVGPLSDSPFATCYPGHFYSYIGGLTHPIDTVGSFSFDGSTGQMTYFPPQRGLFVLAVRINEWRRVSGNWKIIGQTTRDIEWRIIRLYPGTLPPLHPDLKLIDTSIHGAVKDAATGYILAKADTPLNFSFTMKSVDTALKTITVSDNSFFLGNHVVYTNKFTDSVHAHFSWTPSNLDSGLRIFTLTISDSTCALPDFYSTSETIGIPIYVKAHAVPIGIEKMSSTAQINIYPNPTRSEFIIDGQLDEQAVVIEVLDITGRSLLTENVDLVNNRIHKKIISSNNIPDGVYMLRIKGGNLSITKKLLIQK